MNIQTGHQARQAARLQTHTTSTSGLAPSFVQANLLILPSKYASDFRSLCARNPVPCPLLGESSSPGSWSSVVSHLPGVTGAALVSNLDIRTDAPRYMVYHNAHLVKFECPDILQEWPDDNTDYIAFLIGCSYSFETELAANGLTPRHTLLNRNVPMYRSNILLCPAGVFTGATYVVSMRPYPRSALDQVRAITRKYSATHGEPIAWGWDAVERLGIKDLGRPDWGASPLTTDGRPLEETDEEIPVFWGCGVTPQEAVMRAGLEGTIMAHAPGHMLVLDIVDDDVVSHRI